MCVACAWVENLLDIEKGVARQTVRTMFLMDIFYCVFTMAALRKICMVSVEAKSLWRYI